MTRRSLIRSWVRTYRTAMGVALAGLLVYLGVLLTNSLMRAPGNCTEVDGFVADSCSNEPAVLYLRIANLACSQLPFYVGASVDERPVRRGILWCMDRGHGGWLLRVPLCAGVHRIRVDRRSLLGARSWHHELRVDSLMHLNVTYNPYHSSVEAMNFESGLCPFLID